MAELILASGATPATPAAGTVALFADAANNLQQIDETGTVAAPGSPQVKIVDLGVIDIPTVYTGGPLTLHTMVPGEFLASIRFTDTDTVQPDTLPVFSTYAISLGTVKSFGWFGFAFLGPPALAFDSLDLPAGNFGYGPFAALDTAIADKRALVLSTAAAGPIQAAVRQQSSSGYGVRLDAITPWQAATRYDAPGHNPATTPGALSRQVIVANGTLWQNTGVPGFSGGSSPDFVGNAGGSVADPAAPLPIIAATSTYAIIASDDTLNTFTVAGDHTHELDIGFTVSGSTGNNGAYTVAAVVLSGGDTVVSVNETVATNAGDGTITVSSFTVAGDETTAIADVLTFTVSGSTGNDGSYTVADFQVDGGNTVILVNEAVTDTTADGVITLDAIVWHDTAQVLPTVGAVHAVAEIWTPA